MRCYKFSLFHDTMTIHDAYYYKFSDDKSADEIDLLFHEFFNKWKELTQTLLVEEYREDFNKYARYSYELIDEDSISACDRLWYNPISFKHNLNIGG